jgi:thymidylate synthase
MKCFNEDNINHNYYDLLSFLLNKGERRSNRTGIDTLSCFNCSIRAKITDSFPLISLKKTHFRSIVYELLWFLRGDTNIKYLRQNNVHIWDDWADEDGELGPIYGRQWRKWWHSQSDRRYMYTDQIANLVEDLKENPYSRRHIVNSWNVAELDRMKLPPCHYVFQCYVTNDNKLNMLVNMRSTDVFLGLPFNVASYALLTYILGHVCNLVPGEIEIVMCDCHLYTTHVQATEAILIEHSRNSYPLPTLTLSGDVKSVFDFGFDNIELAGYESYPHVSVPVAI